MKFRNSIKTPFALQPPTKLIIDIQGGIQDILGIMFAYNHIAVSGNKQEIIGITCVAGKNSLEDAIRSAAVANKLLGTNIPIFRGQSESLMLKKQYPKTCLQQKFTRLEQHLYQEFGLLQNIDKLIQKQKAVDFISRACLQYQKNLGIVCFGPVTNVGLAHRLESCLAHVKMLSLTGGQYMGMGNTAIGNVQANFAHDPLAAHILFEQKSGTKSLQDKIYVNVFEKSLDFNFKQALNLCLDSGKLNKILDQIFVNMMGINSVFLNCAPILTIVPFLQPATVKNKYTAYGEIIRDGENIDGLLAINWLKIGAKPGQYGGFFTIYEDFDAELINSLFLQAFTNKDAELLAN